ncbi:helix-turn-helix domain-containing protein [Rhodobacteraceae bacterium]|nr:helix-turn-helix domain-containing protein [Paracoccaceae bacterium]
MTSITNDTPWMTTEAAAGYLSVSPGTMHNWRSKGTGPTYKTVGRIVRYHRDDLDAFLMTGAA